MAKRLTTAASNVSDATIQKHIRAITGLKTDLDSAQGDYRAALKAAKTAGINTGQLIAAMAAKKREVEDVKGDFRSYLRYLQLCEVPIQLDMFGAAAAKTADDEDEGGGEDEGSDEGSEQSQWSANEAGVKAGKAGETKETNPHTRGSLEHQAWITGWTQGQETLIEKGGVKAASPRRSRSPSAHLN